jgi:hypothetical protein
MKKLMILAVVAALIGISAPKMSAQVPSSSQGTSTQPDDRQSTQPEDMSAPQPSTGTSTQPNTETSTESQGTVVSQYSEVKAIDLPAAVTRALNEKHPGYKTEKAFIGKDGTYKIKVSKGEENQTLFLDARGEAVKMQK